MTDEEPKNKREARQWIRAYWAGVIERADMGGVADMANDHIDSVWADECGKIADRVDHAK